MAALGTSCNKASEKKISGKWNLSVLQFRDIDNPDWTDLATEADKITAELRVDGTYSFFKDGVVTTEGLWDYTDGVLHIYDKDGEKTALTVNKCSKTYMEWFYSNQAWDDGVQTYWCEAYYTWTR